MFVPNEIDGEEFKCCRKERVSCAQQAEEGEAWTQQPGGGLAVCSPGGVASPCPELLEGADCSHPA